MKKIVMMMLVALMFTITAHAAGVAINETGDQADASAMLDVKSANRGMLVPRMSAAQRTTIPSPATGLQVYQTDGTAGLYIYNGVAWSLVGSGSGTVTNVTASSPISVTNGTTTPAISLGTVGIANGGTGATTQAGAANAILPTQTGNTGKYLTSDGSNVSWGTVASGGGDSSSITATASGALTAGQLVEFNSDGTVKSIVTTNSGTSNAVSSFSAGQVITGAGTNPTPGYVVSTIVGTDKVVIAYGQSDGSYVAAGTLTGNTVTWGTSVKFTTQLYPTSICALEADKFALAYSNTGTQSGSTGGLIVGKITGTAITLGTPYWGWGGGSPYHVVNIGNNRIGWGDSGGLVDNWGYNSSTLAITNYGQYTIASGNWAYTTLTAYATDKMVYGYFTGDLYPSTFTVSGTAAPAFSSIQIPAGTSGAAGFRAVKTSVATDPANILYVWQQSGYTYARIASVTPGTNSIVWKGAATALPTVFWNGNLSLANTSDNMAVLIGSTDGNNMQAVSIDTSGNTPVIGAYNLLFSNGNTTNIALFGGSASGSNGRFVNAYSDAIDSNKPKVVVGQMGSSTIVDRGNATGIVTAGAANGGTATIALLGSNATAYSGLTPGALYYIQSNGSIGTTQTSYPIGVATSSTSLLLNNTNNSGTTTTINSSTTNQIKSASGSTAVYSEFTTGDESVRVYANGKSSFYADGHTDSSLNIDRGTIYTAITINNLASGGAIGTAAATVDMGTAFYLAQTTSGQTITLPSPTNLKPGRIVYICNTGTAAFTAYGSSNNLTAGSCKQVMWTGSVWAGLVQ